MIIFYQISRDTLQMKFDKYEWATRGNFVSYEIRNHDRKAYSKIGVPWEKKILWCNHNYSDSQCNSQFNESRANSKSMQIIVRTNIFPNTSSNNWPFPLFSWIVRKDPTPLKSVNLFTLCRRRTYLTNEIFLESYVKDRVSRQLFGFFCSRG